MLCYQPLKPKFQRASGTPSETPFSDSVNPDQSSSMHFPRSGVNPKLSTTTKSFRMRASASIVSSCPLVSSSRKIAGRELIRTTIPSSINGSGKLHTSAVRRAPFHAFQRWQSGARLRNLVRHVKTWKIRSFVGRKSGRQRASITGRRSEAVANP